MKNHTFEKITLDLEINSIKFGLAGGILIAICIALISSAGLYGYFPFNNMFIADIYSNFGYTLAWPNVVLGTVYGFINGFILTFIFAHIYNWLLRKR